MHHRNNRKFGVPDSEIDDIRTDQQAREQELEYGHLAQEVVLE